jgi:hypothetical protein
MSRVCVYTDQVGMKREVPDSILGQAIDYLVLCKVILANELIEK